MNILPALIKREVLEHKNLLRVPLILIGIAILARLSLVFGNYAMDINLPGELQLEESIKSGMVSVLSKSLNGMNFLIMVVMFIVSVFYALASLYNERQDDSVLFWRSLPISDTMTVASKLLTAVLVVPFLVIACQAVVSFIFLGFDAFNYLIQYYPKSLSIMLKSVLWGLLPIIAWCLFCSEFAKKNPFLLAFIAPIVFVLVDKLFMNGQLSQTLVVNRFTSFSNYQSMSLLWGSAIAIVFLALAVIKRSQRI